jgi:hypothetical protein
MKEHKGSVEAQKSLLETGFRKLNIINSPDGNENPTRRGEWIETYSGTRRYYISKRLCS